MTNPQNEAALVKKIKQAKKIIIISAIVFIVCTVAWIIMINRTVYPQDEIQDTGGNFLFILRRVLLGAAVFGLLQLIYGIYLFFTCSAKLKKLRTII